MTTFIKPDDANKRIAEFARAGYSVYGIKDGGGDSTNLYLCAFASKDCANKALTTVAGMGPAMVVEAP